MDEVGPDNLVAVDGVTQSAGNLAIPLIQPSSGTMELQLRAHRAIAARATSLAAALPQPQASSNGPASLAVVAADNVELTPNRQAIQGLVRQQTAPPSDRKNRKNCPSVSKSRSTIAARAARPCSRPISASTPNESPWTWPPK